MFNKAGHNMNWKPTICIHVSTFTISSDVLAYMIGVFQLNFVSMCIFPLFTFFQDTLISYICAKLKKKW